MTCKASSLPPGPHEAAEEHLQRQLALAQMAHDRRQQAQVLNNLGWIAHIQRGRQAALTWYEQALEIAGADPHARAESSV